MEEKLQREKEKEREEAEAEAVEKKDVTGVTEVKETHNDIEEVPSELLKQPTPFESLTAVDAPTAVDSITYTPGPIRVPTIDPVESNSVASVSELPPVPQTIVEHERLEMIEINNDGTSGHLTHSLE